MSGLTEATIDTVARTIWGEARSEGVAGMQAAAMVIRNRGHDRRWPNDYAEVCFQHLQFSCWNDGDPNRERCVNVDWSDPHFQQAYSIACQTIVPVGQANNHLVDATHGANHYCTAALLDASPPSWANLRKISAQVGAHVFFRL